ncbi:uncharacterized protein LOC115626037 [Scaptodrosophila lebanonensis]|uniref:Uncharacterized protein LOC115626037 n=1 Tax=Drosophila lebanonensis TaxID=7225 RepID=A0A6J2TQB3_DROLE|nr:uncharacterized protein LOC115626037 [Scaptodrosophila lebanonensis]
MLVALKQLLLIHGLLSVVKGENSSLRINTNLKAFEPLPMVSGSAGAAGLAMEANICTREEHYVEHVPVPEMQPVRVRTSSWCLEIPPRCATYKTEMREVMKVQKLNKTRTVRFCCEGYEGNLSDSKAICKPICRGGCGRGNCLSPDICSCEEGYTGKHCTQRCDHDRWGLGCRNPCLCQNDAVCDNKSGICHCIAGWAGQFCEQPCPPGTHGVMCRKACDCADKLCHPQTGDCISQHLPNVTHVMFETLNSTIVNITHNLDHIAKKIGSISEAEHEASSTPKPVPEVILIKQAAEEAPHSPKIILHQSGGDLLENLHSVATGGKGVADVIHVITNWPANGSSPVPVTQQPQIAVAAVAAGDLPTGEYKEHEHAKTAGDHETSLLTTLLIILLIILIGITIAFLYVYRRYHWHKQRVQAAQSNGQTANGQTVTVNAPELVLTEASLGKPFLKPLPELPRHQNSVSSSAAPPELYDTPSNNSSIKTPPYAYARKESLYSVVSPKSRKGSLDSHLYDEIRYHHQQQQQHSASSQPATTHHIAHLIIPPQNSKFLQVPTLTSAHKIAHL